MIAQLFRCFEVGLARPPKIRPKGPSSRPSPSGQARQPWPPKIYRAWRRTSATDESARVRALDSSSLFRSRDPHEVLTERNFMETSLRYTANVGLQTPNVKGNLPYADSNDRGSRP
jgi:hypothetical protein